MNRKDNKTLFSDKRWNEPPVCEVVGWVEFTEEEKKKNKEKLKKILKEKGIIKEQ